MTLNNFSETNIRFLIKSTRKSKNNFVRLRQINWKNYRASMDALSKIDSKELKIHIEKFRILRKPVICLWYSEELYFQTFTGTKKVNHNGKKMTVNEKDYCNTINCAKPFIAFRARLNKIINENNPSNKPLIEEILCELIKRNSAQYQNQKLANRQFHGVLYGENSFRQFILRNETQQLRLIIRSR